MPALRISTVARLASLAMIAAVSYPAHGETVLRWKFEVGQKSRLEMVQEMQMKMSVQQKPMLVTSKSTLDLVWEVTGVDEQGVATLTQKLQRIRMKMQGPQGVMMEYDSQSDKKPEGTAAMMAGPFKTMIDNPYVSKMDPRGNILEMKIPQGLADNMAKIPGGGNFSNLFSEAGLKGMAEIATFPEGPVKPGDTWTRTAVMKNPVTGDGTITTVFRYVGPEVRNGQEVEKIALKIDFQFGEGKQATVKVTDQETSGEIYFDNNRGQVVTGTSKAAMKMEISTMGQQFAQETQVSSKTELLPLEATDK